ncbi:MAG: NADH-quinone oxidoreductase subunit M [Candidatus Omnitrophica bacterium]|nr:NADH-quinone oxidoreductase subunit M [Candidatus Omnitrophota bacterium]
MAFLARHLLSLIVFLPLAAGLAILFIPKERDRWIQAAANGATLLVLILTGWLALHFQPQAPGFQWEEAVPWIGPIHAWYHLGLDGISLPLVFLTALLSFLAAVASTTIPERRKEFFFLYLLLESGMLGTFLALDLFLFYIFWEVVLVPMYFLIGIWGGPRREYAAIKFFLYTLAGSVFMLLSILTCYLRSPAHSFSIPELIGKGLQLGPAAQWWVFLGFFLAFAIKVPIFPFHTWLPDAHVEAPAPISVLLAGVLLKMGGYGFLRISFPLLPHVAIGFSLIMGILGLINIVYGALVAMAQSDFKKLVAYSSVSHMGFVLLGLSALNLTGFNGAALEMFNHGMITGGMFLLVGILYDRTHTRELDAFGGLGAKIPVYGGLLSFFALASLGLPGLSGFVSEFLALLGCFPTHPAITIASASGLVVGAAYFLLMLQRILLGPLKPQWSGLPDAGRREIFTLVPLMIFILWIGLYPRCILALQTPALTNLLFRLGGNIGW